MFFFSVFSIHIRTPVHSDARSISVYCSVVNSHAGQQQFGRDIWSNGESLVIDQSKERERFGEV